MTAQRTIMQNMSLEQVLGTIPSGLFVVNDAMHIVYWNPEAERITGFSAKEACWAWFVARAFPVWRRQQVRCSAAVTFFPAAVQLR